VDLGEFGDALPLIQDYAGRHPGELDSHYLFGAVCRGLGQYETAEAELKRAVQMDPNHYDVRYNLGFVLAKEKKSEEAQRQLQKALELHPDSSEARFQLANVLRALKQADAARAELKQFETEKQRSVAENTTVRQRCKTERPGTDFADRANQCPRGGEVRHSKTSRTLPCCGTLLIRECGALGGNKCSVPHRNWTLSE